MKAPLLFCRRLHTPEVTEEIEPQRKLSDAEDSTQMLWFPLACENNSMGWQPRNAQMICSKHVAPKHGLYSWTHLPFPLPGTFQKLPGANQPTVHHADWYKPVLLLFLHVGALPTLSLCFFHSEHLGQGNFLHVWEVPRSCAPSTNKWLRKSKSWGEFEILSYFPLWVVSFSTCLFSSKTVQASILDGKG